MLSLQGFIFLLQSGQFIVLSPKEKLSLSISSLLSLMGSPAIKLTVLTLRLFGLIFCFVQSSWSHHTTHNKGVFIIILFLL